MSTVQPTFNDVWRMFQETGRQFQEQSREADRRFQEQSREADRRFQEQSREADRRFQETERLLKEKSLETDQRFQETDRLFKTQAAETKRVEELFKSQWGRLMESLVEGDLINILKRRGIAVLDTSTRLKGKTSAGGNYEFDILAHNGEEMVVTEVKTTLRPKDVYHFISRLDQFKVWLPRYAHNRIYGAVAYLTADAAADTMAEKRGLFVIRATGDSASITNAEDFLPRGW